MIAFADTSFLCALYIAQSNSAAAIAHYRQMKEPLHVSALLLGEFRQSVRFQIFRHSRDATQGYDRKAGLTALAKLQENIDTGAVVVASAEWAEVINIAERISARYTADGGHRYVDLLHVATALQLGATDILSFDANQRKLANAEGLATKP